MERLATTYPEPPLQTRFSFVGKLATPYLRGLMFTEENWMKLTRTGRLVFKNDIENI